MALHAAISESQPPWRVAACLLIHFVLMQQGGGSAPVELVRGLRCANRAGFSRQWQGVSSVVVFGMA